MGGKRKEEVVGCDGKGGEGGEKGRESEGKKRGKGKGKGKRSVPANKNLRLLTPL